MAYYKYARRQAGSQVDWSQVSKEVSNTLELVQRERENKKAAIDEATRDLTQKLADAPQGEHKGANEFILDFTENAKESILMANRLMKSGSMSPDQFLKYRQNLNDNSDQLINVIEEFNTQRAKTIENIANNTASFAEIWNQEKAEEFMDFTNTGTYIDPTTFKVSIGKKVQKDGVTRMEDFDSVQSLRNRINFRHKKVNVPELLKADVDKLAKEYEVEGSGNIRSLSDLRENENYDDAIDNLVSSYLTNNFDASSIVGDYLQVTKDGEEYFATSDPEEAKNNDAAILFEYDKNSGMYTPKLSETQEKQAKEKLKGLFDNMMSREITRMNRQFSPDRTTSRIEAKNRASMRSAGESLQLIQAVQESPEVDGYEDERVGYKDVAESDGELDTTEVAPLFRVYQPVGKTAQLLGELNARDDIQRAFIGHRIAGEEELQAGESMSTPNAVHIVYEDGSKKEVRLGSDEFESFMLRTMNPEFKGTSDQLKAYQDKTEESQSARDKEVELTEEEKQALEYARNNPNANIDLLLEDYPNLKGRI